jgi:transposase
VLLAGQGVSGVEIARQLELSVGQVSRIRQRFLQRGVAGLAESPHLGRRDHAVPEQAVALVTALAKSPPPAGRKRWSTRLIAAQVGLSSATVAKILRNAPGQPAREGHPMGPPRRHGGGAAAAETAAARPPWLDLREAAVDE